MERRFIQNPGFRMKLYPTWKIQDMKSFRRFPPCIMAGFKDSLKTRKMDKYPELEIKEETEAGKLSNKQGIQPLLF
jgi:hypothetical protein